MSPIDTARVVEKIDWALSWHLRLLGREFPLRILLPVILISAPILYSVYTLAKTTPQYAAVMTVAPNMQDPRTPQSLLPSAGAGSIARSLGLGGSSSLPVLFDEFLNKLSSPAIANELIRHHPDIMEKLVPGGYDRNARKLIGRPGSGFYLKYVLSLGAYKYQPPGPVELADMLRGKIRISQVAETNMQQVRLYDRDRAFARELLRVLFTLADNSIKQDQSSRARELRDYLSGQLTKQNELSSEEMMRSMLAQYQSQLVLSQLNQPMAAQIVEPPEVGALPETPHYMANLLFGFMISGFLGALYLYYLYIWKARVHARIP